MLLLTGRAVSPQPRNIHHDDAGKRILHHHYGANKLEEALKPQWMMTLAEYISFDPSRDILKDDTRIEHPDNARYLRLKTCPEKSLSISVAYSAPAAMEQSLLLQITIGRPLFRQTTAESSRISDDPSRELATISTLG